MRPPGPVPVTKLKSILNSAAIFFAIGLTFILSPFSVFVLSNDSCFLSFSLSSLSSFSPSLIKIAIGSPTLAF